MLQAALQLIALEWDNVMRNPDHPLDARLDDMRRSNYKCVLAAAP